MIYTTTKELMKEIKMIMIKDELKYTEIAERTGRTRQSVNQIFGRENISMDSLNELVQALGYELNIEFVKKENE